MEQQNNPVEIAQSNEQKSVKKRGRRVRMFLRAVAFLLVLGLIFCGATWVFRIDEVQSYDSLYMFQYEKRGTLDAVYVGGSDVHAFWQPLFGWSDRGIAVWSYSSGALPVAAMKSMLIEAHKTQPQALFIISLSTFKKSTASGTIESIHRVCDYIPFSLNKVRMIHRLTEGEAFSILNKLEMYFPIMRFHSRWDELGNWAFHAREEDYKASRHISSFRNDVYDLSKSMVTTDDRDPLPADIEETINEVLDYCDEAQLNVLFVRVPQASSVDKQARMNTLEDIVIARGYPCLDFMENIDVLGLETKTDYYDTAHTNVHGSLKYSHYLADYLVEHYGFTDKRGTKDWDSWDKAAEAYIESLRYAVLPYEFEDGLRDYSLAIPKLSTPKKNGTTVTLRWSASEGADGYEIFRRCRDGENVWVSIDTVLEDTQYVDEGLLAQTNYRYRVVPYRMIDGVRAYGNFDVNSVSITTGDKK